MNFETLEYLACEHRKELLHEAAVWRSLAVDQPPRAALRTGLVRILRAFGTFALTLGDALAERQ